MAGVARHGSSFAQTDELVRNRRSKNADAEVEDFKPFFFILLFSDLVVLWFS
jgi:hypothetical protein